jgi:hypothetical protein
MKSNSNDIEGRPSAPCSPSSTPESNEAWDAVSRTPDGMYDSQVPISAYAYAMSDHSKKMERQRDELRDAVRAYRDAKGRYHTQKACERLLALLPENARGDTRRDQAGNQECRSSPSYPPHCSASFAREK